MALPYRRFGTRRRRVRAAKGRLGAGGESPGLIVGPPGLEGGCVGTQPQGDVRRLHRLPRYFDELVADGAEVRFVAKPGGEGFEGLSRVILATVETPIY